mgnify:CR=1 FL=1
MAKTAAAATRKRGDAELDALLLKFPEVPSPETGEAEPVSALPVAVVAGVSAAVEGVEAIAALASRGMERGVVVAVLRSMPSSVQVSGLEARKVRV